MKTALTAIEWGRIRVYCERFTAGQLEAKGHAWLSKALLVVIRGGGKNGSPVDLTCVKGRLPSSVVKEALKFCKPDAKDK